MKNFDQLFTYPCWIEFTDEANQIIFSKILHNKLSNEQIDYFLGASDDIVHYDQWFKVAKHILITTHDSHVFWTAGDILSIIWKAVPSDEKSQKWFRDEIFDIFWPRVGSVWPLLNKNSINFNHDEDSKILKDSIGQVLDDLNERLPELNNGYVTFKHDTDPNDFAHHEKILIKKLESKKKNVDELINLFFILTDFVYDDSSVSKLQAIAKDKLIPSLDSSLDTTADAIKMIRRAVEHAMAYVTNLAREQANLAKNLIKLQ